MENTKRGAGAGFNLKSFVNQQQHEASQQAGKRLSSNETRSTMATTISQVTERVKAANNYLHQAPPPRI
jgi:lysyl-tRNA synthetase class I